jgi:hypothetical protein
LVSTLTVLGLAHPLAHQSRQQNSHFGVWAWQPQLQQEPSSQAALQPQPQQVVEQCLQPGRLGPGMQIESHSQP